MLFCKTYGNVLPRQLDRYTTSLLKLLLCLFGHFAFDMKVTRAFQSNTSWQLFWLGCLIFFSHGPPQNVYLLFQSTVSIDKRNILLVAFSSGKRVIVAGRFLF